MKSIFILGFVLAPSLAFAGKVLPGSQHKPPLVFDEPSFSLEVGKSNDGYNWHSHIEFTGAATKNDRARLEWKSGGKVVHTAKCDIGIEDEYVSGSCDNRSVEVKATGVITADLIYSDDGNDTDYLVRTFTFTIVHLKGQWETWGNMSDDTLSGAWIYHATEKDPGNMTYRRPLLYITFAGNTPKNPQLRCTVDGKKKLPDIELGSQSGSDTEEIEIDHQPKGGKRWTIRWNRLKFMMEIYWGKRDTLTADYAKKSDPDKVMSDNPGKWVCDLRTEGKVVRVLTFNVDANGMVQEAEFNTGKGAIPAVNPKVVLVDVRFTKDSSFVDQRINPAAMKKTMQFGLPWPQNPKVKEIQATYPAALTGLADPK